MNFLSQVKQNERKHVTRVDTTDNLIVDGDDGGLSGVTGSVRRLTTGQQTLRLSQSTAARLTTSDKKLRLDIGR